MEFSDGRARDGFYSLKEKEEEVFWRRGLAPSAASRPWDAVAKEHMFDKVVTPSDVGKLNRLVIPKQHAEKYFPLSAEADRAGLLLSFEDREGGAWRFRYSYWRSSQSYVMTKGWSRFVKEKRLDAGDTVSFARARGGDDDRSSRLFIDWKRRPVLRIPFPGLPCAQAFEPCWGAHPHFFPPPPPPPPVAMVYQHHSIAGPLLFFQTPANGLRPSELKPSTAAGGPVDQCQATASKAVWLFGVNLLRPELKGEADAAGGSEGKSLSTAHPLPQLQHSSVESSSLASSSSTSKEQHSCLDLDL